MEKKENAKCLFRLPDAAANAALEYCDDKDLSNLLLVSKSWEKKINEIELGKRKNYLKYFMWYIYGCGNAGRLCKIVDNVVNEHKNEIGDDENKKFLLWHMILLDILNIKAADLKLDFDKEKSESVEEAIKNRLLSGEAVNRRNNFIDTENTKIRADHPERLLWEYSGQIFPEFENIQTNGWCKTDANVGTALLGRIFACFLKVSFYQMKRIEDPNTDKDNQEICQEYKEKIYKFNEYLYYKIFNDRGYQAEITSSIATYLFKTGELETWFCHYNKDFFSFFCNPDYFICPDDGESFVEFFDFAFYLNKIKSFETRYQENSDEFWQTFYTNIVSKCSYRGNYVLIDITSFISKIELKNKMIGEIDAFWGYGDYDRCNLFNHKKLEIDLEKNYFNPIIIRFCGKKQLTDEVIQSIFNVIESKDGLDHKDEAEINAGNDKAKNNQIVSNEINFKDEFNSVKNNVGFLQHFIFVLLFMFACLSLFLCFQISIYFLIPSVICFCADLFLGFKNYFSCCYSLQKIESQFNENNQNILDRSTNIDSGKTIQLNKNINGEIIDE